MSEIFLLNVFRMNGQKITKFCIHIIIDKIYVGIVKRHFSQIWNRVTARNWYQKLVFAQYLDNEWTESNQICLYITIDMIYAPSVLKTELCFWTYFLSSDSAMEGLWSDPLTILVFAGNH